MGQGSGQSLVSPGLFKALFSIIKQIIPALLVWTATLSHYHLSLYVF